MNPIRQEKAHFRKVVTDYPRTYRGPSCVDNKWQEYERLKRELPLMEAKEYEKAITAICQKLNL
jgi:hypothetical protein